MKVFIVVSYNDDGTLAEIWSTFSSSEQAREWSESQRQHYMSPINFGIVVQEIINKSTRNNAI